MHWKDCHRESFFFVEPFLETRSNPYCVYRALSFSANEHRLLPIIAPWAMRKSFTFIIRQKPPPSSRWNSFSRILRKKNDLHTIRRKSRGKGGGGKPLWKLLSFLSIVNYGTLELLPSLSAEAASPPTRLISPFFTPGCSVCHTESKWCTYFGRWTLMVEAVVCRRLWFFAFERLYLKSNIKKILCFYLFGCWPARCEVVWSTWLQTKIKCLEFIYCFLVVYEILWLEDVSKNTLKASNNIFVYWTLWKKRLVLLQNS